MRQQFLGLILLTTLGCAQSQKTEATRASGARFFFSEIDWVGVLPTLGEGHVVKSWGFSFLDLKNEIMSQNPTLVCSEFTQSERDTALEALFPIEFPAVEEAARDLGAIHFGADWTLPFQLTEEPRRDLDRDQRALFEALGNELIRVPSRFASLGWNGLLESRVIDEEYKSIHRQRARMGSDAADGFYETRSQRMVLSCLRHAQRTRAKRVLFVAHIDRRAALFDAVLDQTGKPPANLRRLSGPAKSELSPRILRSWRRQQALIETYMNDDGAGPEIQERIRESRRREELNTVVNAFSGK
jgi:hypothetical protein